MRPIRSKVAGYIAVGMLCAAAGYYLCAYNWAATYTRRDAFDIYRELQDADLGQFSKVLISEMLRDEAHAGDIFGKSSVGFAAAERRFGSVRSFEIISVGISPPFLRPRTVLLKVVRSGGITEELLIGQTDSGFGQVEVRPWTRTGR